MSTYTRVCTRRQAERVRDQIAKLFGSAPDDAPTLMEEGFDGRQWTIVWGGGGRDAWVLEAIQKIPAPPGCHLDAQTYSQLVIDEGDL